MFVNVISCLNSVCVCSLGLFFFIRVFFFLVCYFVYFLWVLGFYLTV